MRATRCAVYAIPVFAPALSFGMNYAALKNALTVITRRIEVETPRVGLTM
jgi:hypothetical protein